MVRVRENAESVAFYGGEASEQRLLFIRLQALVENAFQLLRTERNLQFFTSFYRSVRVFHETQTEPPFLWHVAFAFEIILAKRTDAEPLWQVLDWNSACSGGSPTLLPGQDRIWRGQPEFLCLQPHPARRLAGRVSGKASRRGVGGGLAFRCLKGGKHSGAAHCSGERKLQGCVHDFTQYFLHNCSPKYCGRTALSPLPVALSRSLSVTLFFFLAQFESIAGFSAIIDRLGEFTEVLEPYSSRSTEASEAAGSITLESVSPSEGSPLLRLEQVTLRSPDGAITLVQDLTAEVGGWQAWRVEVTH